MHIVFEHREILPVTRYGGTERVLYWLMKYLVRAGVQVTLIGHPESRVEHIGVGLIAALPGEKDIRRLIPQSADLVHLTYAPAQEFPKPVLVTIHGNGKPGEVFHPNTVFVSQSHASQHGSDQYVHNGVDLEEYPYDPGTRRNASWENFLFLAKAKWKVKNLKGSVRACKQARKHLHIAGGRVWSLSPLIHSYGMADHAAKLELFKKCDALLNPVLWNEPFGLAMVEAMAMGLPVIGSPYGSLPEVIGETGGWVCRSQDEVVGLLRNRPSFQPEIVRDRVVKNFTAERMAQSYIAKYRAAIAGSLQKSAPRTLSERRAEELLQF